MLANIKKAFKWGSLVKKSENKNWQSSLLLAAFVGVLEDVLFWKNMWLSLIFIFIFNIIYFICLHLEVNFMEFIFYLTTVIVALDGFESWLKYKHRTTCLKKLASHNGTKLSSAASYLKQWMKMHWCEYVYLRETNHTKAFLMMNIILGMIFLVGKYFSGYKLMYIVLMVTCLFYKIAKPVVTLAHKIQQNAESDGELEGLIPEITEGDIKILSLEPETKHVVDERQSLDYWKPVDVPMEDSDSSDHSSSLVTNMSVEKMQAFEKEVDITDSSEDEYIPLVQQKQLPSTLEEVQPSGTWGGTAYNAFFNFAGAVSNMVYASQEENKRKRMSSIDSSDGFEIIDKSDLN
ncbi:uncharacterized protein LOC134742113 [Cydia strobilella]|uniref:uncharacterized protein LOC134742113 n=1 Tax=Cydia strobilella TaxID=1100964 RepID=UPI003004A436